MASTAKTPDPMTCALSAALLPGSRVHGCRVVGFIDIKDMYNNYVGKGGAYVYEVYEAK
jgi:hypothetical protein